MSGQEAETEAEPPAPAKGASSEDAASAPPPGAADRVPSEVAILGLDGSPAGGRTAALPDAFASPPRRDLVHKAYTILDSHRYQPKGVHPTAGMDNSADSFDPPTGRGRSRVARIRGSGGGGRSGEAAEVASTRGGRQAHPPRAEKRIHKRINRTERRLALRSAIAATASRRMVEGRGHRVPPGAALPIVVSGEIERVGRASELSGVLGALGLQPDVDRLGRRRSRSGRSALRGRSKKAGRSVLFVVGGGEAGGGPGGPSAPEGAAGEAPSGQPSSPSSASSSASPPAGAVPPLMRAAGSIPGVDVVRAGDMSVLDLAPGSEPGRLAVYTPDALEVIGRTASLSLARGVRKKRRAVRRKEKDGRAGGGGGSAPASGRSPDAGGADAAAAAAAADGVQPAPAPKNKEAGPQ